MDGSASAEIAQVDNTEKTQVDKTEDNAKTEQPKTNRFTAVLRRVFGGLKEAKPSSTPETPATPQELTLEQQIAQSEARVAQLTTDQKNIVDQSLGDMTIADRRMATQAAADKEEEQRVLTELRAKAEANQAPKPEVTEQPTAVPVAPNEQQPPAEEPKVA